MYGEKNIFVIGLDDFNLGELQSIDNAGSYRFIGVFETDELMRREEKHDMDSLIRMAKAKIDSHPGSVEGIIGFYDFPVTLLAFYLCGEYGVKGPSLISGLKCEHKYWSRLEQSKEIPDQIPAFTAIDPFDPPDFDRIELHKPFWLKPVKSFASQLGFQISSEEEYAEALGELRKGIHFFADPVNQLLSKVQLPDEIKDIDGSHCIAEELIHGR